MAGPANLFPGGAFFCSCCICLPGRSGGPGRSLAGLCGSVWAIRLSFPPPFPRRRRFCFRLACPRFLVHIEPAPPCLTLTVTPLSRRVAQMAGISLNLSVGYVGRTPACCPHWLMYNIGVTLVTVSGVFRFRRGQGPPFFELPSEVAGPPTRCLFKVLANFPPNLRGCVGHYIPGGPHHVCLACLASKYSEPMVTQNTRVSRGASFAIVLKIPCKLAPEMESNFVM